MIFLQKSNLFSLKDTKDTLSPIVSRNKIVDSNSLQFSRQCGWTCLLVLILYLFELVCSTSERFFKIVLKSQFLFKYQNKCFHLLEKRSSQSWGLGIVPFCVPRVGSRTSSKKNPRGCARNKSLPFSLDFLDLHFRTRSRVKIALSHIPSQKRKLILSAVQKKSEINKVQNLGMNNVEYRIDRYTLKTSQNKQPPSWATQGPQVCPSRTGSM